MMPSPRVEINPDSVRPIGHDVGPKPKRYATGRVCTFDGCGTVLSVYNPEDQCFRHPIPDVPLPEYSPSTKVRVPCKGCRHDRIVTWGRVWAVGPEPSDYVRMFPYCQSCARAEREARSAGVGVAA